MKANGEVVKEFVALHSKSYSTKMDNDIEMKEFNGVKLTVFNNLLLEDYKTCLFNFLWNLFNVKIQAS